jgi:hypothetical protein
MKHMDKTAKVLQTSVDSEDGLFHGVNMYQWMYSAIFQRDVDAIQQVIRHFAGFRVLLFFSLLLLSEYIYLSRAFRGSQTEKSSEQR